MPVYTAIDGRRTADRRAAQGLLTLKDAFDTLSLPSRTIADTVMLATWNIREFDSTKYGTRGKESLLYIAEIINRFDVVAVQEVREDLSALHTVMRYLGGWWKYLLTDVTEGTRGNRERMAFLYDSRKITFGGLAGEVVIPPMRSRGALLTPANQLARTPFLVGFQAGWFKFTLCTTHILYGTARAIDPERLAEIQVLAQFLAERAGERHAWARNMILLGDFNIFDTSDETLQAISRAGFILPQQLQQLPSNAPKTKHYDQIAFIAPDIQDQLQISRAGVFNFFDYVYRPDHEPLYVDEMGKAYHDNKTGEPRSEDQRAQYYNDWRTYHMSDHLPMWIELRVDFGREYLRRKLALRTVAQPLPDAAETRGG